MRENIQILFDDRTGQNVIEKFGELLSEVAAAVLEMEAVHVPLEISVSFIDDHEIQIMNNKFRHIDKPTDVLSFPLLDAFPPVLPLGEPVIELGDIVISYERACAQAQEYGHSIEREMAFLTAHSMLHLLGYDHMTEADEMAMNRKQEDALQQLGILR